VARVLVHALATFILSPLTFKRRRPSKVQGTGFAILAILDPRDTEQGMSPLVNASEVVRTSSADRHLKFGVTRSNHSDPAISVLPCLRLCRVRWSCRRMNFIGSALY